MYKTMEKMYDDNADAHAEERERILNEKKARAHQRALAN